MRHEAHAWEVAFDPSGQMIVSTSGEQYLRPEKLHLWDVAADAPYPTIELPFRPLKPRSRYHAYSGSLSKFDTLGELRVRTAADDAELVWRLPTPPADPYLMRRMTWQILGMRRDIDGSIVAIAADKWQELQKTIEKNKE